MNKKQSINRRGFLKASAFGVLGAGAVGNGFLHADEKKTTPEFPKIKEYRILGRTGFKASDIGIGTSRVYPTPVMKALLDAGVNYIDTAEGYGRGQSEINVGEAIKGRNRKSLFITSKLRLRGEETKETILSRFRQCLQRLQTEYIDCLMMHGPQTAAALKMESFHQAVKQLKNEGKLRFIGVSNHGPRSRGGGEAESMEKILVGAAVDGRFDVILVVYNFLKRDEGEKVLDACKAKNVGATIMKSDPVGRYYGMKERMEQMKKEGKEISPRRKAYFERMKETAEKAEFFIKKHNLQNPGEIHEAAIRFVLSNPNVHVLNLAFKSFEDVENMLKLSGSRLDTRDKQTLAAFTEGCGDFYCRHACGICESSCPHHVPINTIMRYNHYFEAHGSEKYAMEKYARLSQESLVKAAPCQTCKGECEQACPYRVPIQGLLVMAHQQLTLA
jgi:predicted aldo/keto reductase-like oxidoreductase